MSRTWTVSLALAMCIVSGASLPGTADSSAMAVADTLSFGASKDNSLFEYNPNQPKFNVLRSNSTGDFISAGRTNANSQLQRGLIQFDVISIPANAVIQDVQLRLRMLDVPANVTLQNMGTKYWMLPSTQDWGEPIPGSHIGLADGGSGRGADSAPNDATWLHTLMPDALWTHPGALLPDPGSDGRVTIPDSDPSYVGTAPTVLTGTDDDFVTWSSAGLIQNIQDWVTGASPNYGWIILGDESYAGSNRSSKRSFASRENAEASFRPELRVTFALVPEPATWLLAVIGLMVAGTCMVCRRQNHR